MIRRFHEAKQSGAPTVTLWGSGTPRREFLHVDDLAAACLHLLEHYDDPAPINVGTGADLTIRELAETVAERRRLRRAARLGHQQARRHPAQAPRREPTAGARLEARDHATRGYSDYLLVVSGPCVGDISDGKQAR